MSKKICRNYRHVASINFKIKSQRAKQRHRKMMVRQTTPKIVFVACDGTISSHCNGSTLQIHYQDWNSMSQPIHSIMSFDNMRGKTCICCASFCTMLSGDETSYYILLYFFSFWYQTQTQFSNSAACLIFSASVDIFSLWV